ELFDVQLAVEPQVVRIGAQEAFDIGLPGQHVELLLLEGAQVLATNLRRLLDLRKVEALPQTSLAEAVADLEHGAWSLRQEVELDRIDGHRDGGGQREIEREPAQHLPYAGRPPAPGSAEGAVEPAPGPSREANGGDGEDGGERHGKAGVDEAQVSSRLGDGRRRGNRGKAEQRKHDRPACRAVSRPGPVTA